MGRSIIDVRADMVALAELLDSGECSRHAAAAKLHQLADDTYRNPAVKKAAPTARKMTDDLAFEVREYARDHQTMSNRQIGRHFGIDGGRVSEAMNGKVWGR